MMPHLLLEVKDFITNKKMTPEGAIGEKPLTYIKQNRGKVSNNLLRQNRK